MRRAIPEGINLKEYLEKELLRLRFQTKNSTNSTLTPIYECPICKDSGIISEIVRVDTGREDPDGNPIFVDELKTGPNGYPELCECRKRKIFEKYNASASMKENERERTFETADIDLENKFAFLQARKFVGAIEEHLKEGTWLYIHGDQLRAKEKGLSGAGTGKSYLTHCIGNYLTQQKNKAIYVTEDKLFEEIRATYNRSSDETESEVLYRYQNVPILLIDDLFKSKITDWVEDKVFHLLNNRARPGMVTIINSNFAPNRIEEQMPKNGPFIASRIIGQAVLIEMIGHDRRRAIAKKRLKEMNDDDG